MALFLILLTGFLVRIFLSQYGTYYNDLYAFSLWSLDLIRYGFDDFYSIAKSDYPPGFLYILWFTGKVYYFLNAHGILAPLELTYKSPFIISDILNALLIYLIVKKIGDLKKAFIGSCLYLFNPVLIINSTLWGQNDSLVTFFIISSFYFLVNKKIFISAILLGIGVATKQLVLFCLPIYLIYLLSSKISIFKLVTFILIFFTSAILLFIPFFSGGNFFEFISQRMQTATSWFPYTTLNAFNFWAIFSDFHSGTIDFVSDQIKFLGISLRNWGYILFSLFYAFISFTLLRKLELKKNFNLILTFSLVLIYFSMFILLTQIRERHLYYGLTFLTILIPFLPRKYNLFILPGFIIYGLNLYYSFITTSQPPPFNSTVINLLSAGNLLIFIFLIFNVWVGFRKS